VHVALSSRISTSREEEEEGEFCRRRRGFLLPRHHVCPTSVYCLAFLILCDDSVAVSSVLKAQRPHKLAKGGKRK
jgi:hypothetical protein